MSEQVNGLPCKMHVQIILWLLGNHTESCALLSTQTDWTVCGLMQVQYGTPEDEWEMAPVPPYNRPRVTVQLARCDFDQNIQ